MEKKFYIIQFIIILLATLVTIAAFYFSSKGRVSGVAVTASLLFSALVLAVFADMYLIEPNWIKIEKVMIQDPVLADALRGVKVVQISDLHLESIGFRERQLISKINELKPDVLFITGDYFSDRKDPTATLEFRALLELLKQLKVSGALCGVLGNYDPFLIRHPEHLFELRAAGLDILQNETRKILLPNKKAIWLASTTESWAKQRKPDAALLKQTLEPVPTDAPVILLNHYPDIFGKAHTAGINLVLAGHTHGGQINIPFLIHMSNSANKSPYMSGLFDSGKTKMYVNRGIGTTNLPVRFLCRPEITVFEFKK